MYVNTLAHSLSERSPPGAVFHVESEFRNTQTQDSTPPPIKNVHYVLC